MPVVINPPPTNSTVFVYTSNGGKGKWSRYEFPYTVDAYAQLADALYIRHGDTIAVLDEGVSTDQVGTTQVPFSSRVEWGYLDCGTPGANKMLEGFDVVGSGTPSVSVGWDQRDTTKFTDPYTIEADTMPGDIIPLSVIAPTFAMRLTYASGPWKLHEVNLYVHDERPTT